MLEFSQSKRLYLMSKLVIACWLLLIVNIFVGFPLAFLLNSFYPFFIPFGVFLIFAFPYILMAFITKCEKCGKNVTIQTFKQPTHVRENKVYGFIGWSGIILNVFKNKKFIYWIIIGII